MRVLFLTPANKSHLHIAAPFAWALRNAGHEVLVAAQSDLADSITPTGLTGTTVGDPLAKGLTDQMNEQEPEKAPQTTESLTPRFPVQADYAKEDQLGELAYLVENLFPVMCPDDVFTDLVELARDWRPDLVIWDMLTYAGPVAARACGAAHARLVLATDGFGQLRSAFHRQRTEGTRDPLREWLQPKLAEYGCEFAEDVAVGDWTLDPMPAWTWHPEGVHYLPVRHLPFNGPAIAPRWLFEKPERQRVCITLGNSHRDAGRVEASAGALIGAVSDLDVEVVATLHRDQLDAIPRLPDNVRIVDFLPLNVLLGSCSAIIHHGGAGTFSAAVEHGVPQLISPSTWWSEMWYGPVAMANGVQERGAGMYVADSDRLTADALRDSLLRVLKDDTFARNAARLRDETLAMPTPNDIVPALEKLTAQHQGERRTPRG